MSIPLRIFLFGRFEVFVDGEPLKTQDWKSQQTRLIFKMLLARWDQVVSSDQIIEHLWPSESPETARRRLHVRISQLRTALGAGKSNVQTVDGGYLFCADENCWLDVDAFQSAIEEGYCYQENKQQLQAIQAYEKARSLCRGEFLAEDLYADWIFQDREAYREQFLTLLTELSEGYAHQGRYRMAIARAQEALMLDPVRETIYIRLMLYHYFAGERSKALRVYEGCCKALADEMAVKPLVSTVKLAEQIQAGTLWASNDTPRYPPPIYEGRLFEIPYSLSETPFIGRDREYAWLIDQWQNQENQAIFVAGEAGIGKSRLVNEFAGYIASQGAIVLRSRVAPGEHSPFSPVITALQPLMRENQLQKMPAKTLAALAVFFPEISDMGIDLPRLPQLPPEGERNRFYAAFKKLVETFSPRRILLLVDDAHRTGLAACEMLAQMSASLQVLLSYRSEETPLDHPVFKAFGAPQKKRAILQLRAFSLKDVESLIREMSQNELPEIVSKIYDRTEGNPLYVVALLQHMFEAGQLYVDVGGGWGLAAAETPQLPSTIRETIETRLRRLNRAQHQIFDLIAVLGGSFDFTVLQQASEHSEEELLEKIDELMDLALISEPRSLGLPEFAVTHDRYIEVACETLPAVRRRQLHLQAAKALESVYAGDLSNYYAVLADHYAYAKVLDYESHYAVLAGKQAAAQYANATALRYLGRALELTPPNEIDQRFRLLLAREKVYDLLGDRQNQKDDLDDMALLSEKLDLSQQAEIVWRKAAFEWVTGEVETASALLEDSIAQAHSSGAVEIEVSSLLLKSRCVTYNLELSHEYLETALVLAQENGLRVIQGDIVRNLGNIHFWLNDYVHSRAYFKEALAIHREVGDLRGELSAFNNLGHLSQLTGELVSAREFFQQGLEICNKIGDRLAEGVILGNLGSMLVELGDYNQAEIHLKRAIEIREEIKNDEGVGSLLPIKSDALRRQGKYSEAKIQLDRSLEINVRIEHPQQQCLSLDGLSQLHRDMGDYISALAYYEQALDVLDDQQSPNRVRAIANGCLLHRLMGDHTQALEIGEQALDLSEAFPQFRAIALKNLGHVLVALEKYEEAKKKYLQALALYQELNQTHLQSEPLAGLAQVALKRGADQQALSYVEEILPSLETTPLVGPDQPVLVYLICFQVLEACNDPRAHQILMRAHEFLQSRQVLIADEVTRKTYFENIAVHRTILHQIQK